MEDELIDAVADVHAVDWEAHGLGAALPGPQLQATVERWVTYVEWSSGGDPLPALAAGPRLVQPPYAGRASRRPPLG